MIEFLWGFKGNGGLDWDVWCGFDVKDMIFFIWVCFLTGFWGLESQISGSLLGQVCRKIDLDLVRRIRSLAVVRINFL